MKNKEKYFDWFDYKFFIVFALFFLPLAVVNKNIIYKFDIYKNISIDYHSNNNPYSMSVEFLEFAKLLPFDLVILNDPYGKYPLNIYFPVYTTTQVPFASSKDQISRNMVLDGSYPLFSGKYDSSTVKNLLNLMKKHSASLILVESKNYDLANQIVTENNDLFIIEFDNPQYKELVLKLKSKEID